MLRLRYLFERVLNTPLHYPTYLFSQDSNELYCFDDEKVNCFNFDRLMSIKNSTFKSETHTIFYFRSDNINSFMTEAPII